ncbi:DUF7683 domain-containing protein [Streptomyces canus]|uniref:DUF7683 domain-containing protein n=1 Tax=Streptomyces canus TaxID=58343 RepID=UPI00278928F8|nr:hypothetical protein [Streptomyces canus]MDQ0761698.1 hypothetical protein [Streptomyces canus]MDQ1069721.1 hypothetical protein [Streptomyces canus]
MSIVYALVRYPKDDDYPDSTTDVTAVGGQAWAELLTTPLEQLVDVYPLTQEHAERVRQFTGVTLDLERYEYFLEPEEDPSL